MGRRVRLCKERQQQIKPQAHLSDNKTKTQTKKDLGCLVSALNKHAGHGDDDRMETPTRFHRFPHPFLLLPVAARHSTTLR